MRKQKQNLMIDLKYSAYGGAHSVLLRIRSKNFMDRGSGMSWISVFPHEKEFLFPPITYLRPFNKEAHMFLIGGVFTIVSVVAKIPSCVDER